jgi:hypothetical protein
MVSADKAGNELKNFTTEYPEYTVAQIDGTLAELAIMRLPGEKRA